MADREKWNDHKLKKYREIAQLEARKRIQNPKLADEVAERAFFQLVTRIALLRPPENPDSWIRAVVQNRATKAFERPEARTVQLDEIASEAKTNGNHASSEVSLDSERWFVWREHLLAIEPRLVSRLTPLQTKVLHHLLNGQSVHETARACQVQPGQVRRSREAIIQKATKILRNLPLLPPPVNAEDE